MAKKGELNEIANAAKTALLHLPRPQAQRERRPPIPRCVRSSRCVAKTSQNFGKGLAVLRHERATSAGSLASRGEKESRSTSHVPSINAIPNHHHRHRDRQEHVPHGRSRSRRKHRLAIACSRNRPKTGNSRGKFFNVSMPACARARELVSIRGQYLRQWRSAREPGCTRKQADHSQPL